MISHIKISPQLLKECVDHNRLRHYAVWLYLKNCYSNGTIYRYTFRSIYLKSGLSRTSIRKYVPAFVAWGWCREHAGNLCFNKHQEPTTLLNIKSFTATGIYDALCAFLLHNQQPASFLQCNGRSGKGDFAYKRSANLSPTICTVERAGRLFKRSSRAANHIILKLQKQGWFERIKRFNILVEEGTRQMLQTLKMAKDVSPRAYYYRGHIVEPVPSQWRWITKPTAPPA